MRSPPREPELSFAIVLPRWHPGLSALCFLAFLVLAMLHPLFKQLAFCSGDTFMHIRIGNEILSRMAIPKVDFLSHTRFGNAYVAHEWGFEVLIALAYRWFSTDGVLLLTALCGATTMGLLVFRMLSRSRDTLSTLLCLPPLLYLLTTLLYCARPHMFSYVGLSLGLMSLDARTWRKRKLWVAAAHFGAFALWINIHPGVLVFLGLLALEIGWSSFRDRTLAAWGALIVLVSIAGTFCNPYGPTIVINTVRFLWEPVYFNRIIEHMPLDLASNEGLVFLAVFVPVLAYGVLYQRSARWAEIMRLLALAILTLKSSRWGGFFAIAAAPLFAETVQKIIKASSLKVESANTPTAPKTDKFILIGATSTAVLAVALSQGKLSQDAVYVHPKYPVAAVEYIRKHLDEFGPRMFNFYDSGGFLTFALPERKVFVDGRAEFYGGDFLLEHEKIALGDQSLERLDHWHVDWAIIPEVLPLAPILVSAGWRIAFHDGVNAVLVKPTAKPAASAWLPLRDWRPRAESCVSGPGCPSTRFARSPSAQARRPI